MTGNTKTNWLIFLVIIALTNLGVSYFFYNPEPEIQHLEPKNNKYHETREQKIQPNHQQVNFSKNLQQIQSLTQKSPQIPKSRLLILSNSTNSTCGDTQKTFSQQCDDGNQINGDGCDQNCKLELCGDAVITKLEECDDGNTKDGDGCTKDCKIQKLVCGDGIVQGQQQCDDGNTKDGDGCSPNCRKQTKSMVIPLAVGISGGIVALGALAASVYMLCIKSKSTAPGGKTLALDTQTPKFQKYRTEEQIYDIQ